MTYNQDANAVVNDSEEKMIGKGFEVYAPEVALANAVSFGIIG